MLYYSIAGLIVGLIAGTLFPTEVPVQYTKLLSVAILAGLDAVLGALRAVMVGNYDTVVFISGFFVNGILAMLLTYIGNLLGIDLYLIGTLVFGMRIFQNIAVIRRLYMGK